MNLLLQAVGTHDLVIAMDIGTYGCAYALQETSTFNCNPTHIVVNEKWDDGYDRKNKTMTAVLLNVSYSLSIYKSPIDHHMNSLLM